MADIQTPEDLKAKLMIDAIRAYERASDADSRKAAAKNILKAGRTIGLNDAETDALAKILAQPGEIAALTTKTIIDLAQKKSDQLIDLQRQWANAFMRQGDSVAGMAGLARTIATIASLFGATELADMLHKKADVEMAKAESQYVQARAKMEQDTGSTNNMTQAIRDALKVTTDKRNGLDVTAATGQVATNAGTIPQRDVVDYGDDEAELGPSAPPAQGRQRITWKQFHENMDSLGVNKATQEQLRALYETNSSFDKTKEDGVIDSRAEGQKLVAGIKRAEGLSESQKTELHRKLHIAAPELIPA